MLVVVVFLLIDCVVPTCLVMDCSCLCNCSLQDLAYAQVAEYLRPKDSLDYLGHQLHVLESDTKALQLLLGKSNMMFIHVFILQ